MKPSAVLRTLLMTWALIVFGNFVAFLTGGLNTFDHAVYAMLGAGCMSVMVYAVSWREAQREPLPWEDSIPPDAPAPENEVAGKKKTVYMLPPGVDSIRSDQPPEGTFSGESWAATSNGRAAVIAASRADPDLEAQPYIVRPWTRDGFGNIEAPIGTGKHCEVL